MASRSRVFHKMLYQPPSPQQPINHRGGKKDKESQRETNKLRLFLKRSSEPLLNLQNAAQQVCKMKKKLVSYQSVKRKYIFNNVNTLQHNCFNITNESY